MNWKTSTIKSLKLSIEDYAHNQVDRFVEDFLIQKTMNLFKVKILFSRLHLEFTDEGMKLSAFALYY